VKKSALTNRVEYLEGLLQRVAEDQESRAAEDRAFAAELEPYELRDARSTYVSGQDPYRVAVALLAEASQLDAAVAGVPTTLNLTVQWVPAGLDKEPSYFAGNLTVEG